MNNADLANERAFAEVKRLCLMGLDSTTLRQRVTERMRQAVPFEAYAAFTMDPSNGLITHAIQTIGDESGLRVYLERVFFEDDVLGFDWMVRTGCRWGSSRKPRKASLRRPRVTASWLGPRGTATNCVERLVRAPNSGAGWLFGERRDVRTLPLGRSPLCAGSPRI